MNIAHTMETSPSKNQPRPSPSSENREVRIREFGRMIFDGIGREQPTTFNKNYWSGRIMEWAMTQPEFKVNMFRLVDVLPTLKSSAAVMRHVNEYLGGVAKHIHGLIDWGVNVNPHSLRAKITALVVRKSVQQMAAQFIAGATPEDALKPLRRLRKSGLAFTADLLGEFSVSEKEATAYLERYLSALSVFGSEMPRWREAAPLVDGHPGESSPVCISVKLTALYSQCNVLNMERSVQILSSRLSQIVRKAREVSALVYVDAEDMGSNPMVYETFKAVFGSEEFKTFPLPGIVVQAYAKGARQLLLELLDFARTRGSPIAVRLVKGAYWDYETIVCAQNNWPSPLFKNKESSDANYEELSRILLENTSVCLPAFASHNIRSLAHACCLAEELGVPKTAFELQMLFGMAEPIARTFAGHGFLTRLYVPLGEMLPGMGYLVRRLLENTSNESFLRHTFFDENQIDDLLAKPILKE